MDITIVIPVFNRKDYIEQTLRSIPAEYPVILVDNGSSDGSLELITRLARQRAGTTVTVEHTPGAAAARNKGLSLCRSRWVYFFDSDDIFTALPTTWDDTADMVCIPTRQQIGGKPRTRAYSPVKTPHTHILNSMLNTPSMIFSTAFLRQIGGWDSRCLIWDDWELGLRALLMASHVEWLTSKAYHTILIHPDSLTGNSLSSRIDQLTDTLAIAFDDIQRIQPQNLAAFAALFFRCYIMSGQMLHEGRPDASRRVHEFISSRFSVNRQSHQMGRLLEWAASRGIRGTWRLALWIVNARYKTN